MVTLTTQIDPSLKQKLKELAVKRGITVKELVNEAIRTLVEEGNNAQKR